MKGSDSTSLKSGLAVKSRIRLGRMPYFTSTPAATLSFFSSSQRDDRKPAYGKNSRL